MYSAADKYCLFEYQFVAFYNTKYTKKRQLNFIKTTVFICRTVQKKKKKKKNILKMSSENKTERDRGKEKKNFPMPFPLLLEYNYFN
jgi:hypothetical protein